MTPNRSGSCSLRGGMIVRIRHDPEKDEALKAAGLRVVGQAPSDLEGLDLDRLLSGYSCGAVRLRVCNTHTPLHRMPLPLHLCPSGWWDPVRQSTASAAPKEPAITGANRRTERRPGPPLFALQGGIWLVCERRLPESNRCKRLCRPLRNHSAKAPSVREG